MNLEKQGKIDHIVANANFRSTLTGKDSNLDNEEKLIRSITGKSFPMRETLKNIKEINDTRKTITSNFSFMDEQNEDIKKQLIQKHIAKEYKYKL